MLKSRNALAKWDRFLWKRGKEERAGGHIVRQYSYDTTSQETLCAHAVTELKKICDTEVNYEVEIRNLRGAKTGDRVNIVDDAGALYLSTRILYLETSEVDKTITATMGEHLLKKSGISQKVEELAEQFGSVSITAGAASAAAYEAKKIASDGYNQLEEETAALWDSMLALGSKAKLWEGRAELGKLEQITLSAPISGQTSGILLVFSPGDAESAEETEFATFLVAKNFIENIGGKYCGFTMADSAFNLICHKLLYITDTVITGCPENTTADTGTSGIAYDNSSFVLRCVYGM